MRQIAQFYNVFGSWRMTNSCRNRRIAHRQVPEGEWVTPFATICPMRKDLSKAIFKHNPFTGGLVVLRCTKITTTQG
jgi:hypothetical protein